MKIIKQEQVLPISLHDAWDFFSNPENLNVITPPKMVFEITSTLPKKMYEGMLITYKIEPLLKIPMKWCTEITHIRELSFFTDEQRIGPYRLWHHEHHFRQVENGVLMTDLLYYDIGKGILGKIAGALFVHKAVQSIFDYRKKKLTALFKKIE